MQVVAGSLPEALENSQTLHRAVFEALGEYENLVRVGSASRKCQLRETQNMTLNRRRETRTEKATLLTCQMGQEDHHC